MPSLNLRVALRHRAAGDCGSRVLSALAGRRSAPSLILRRGLAPSGPACARGSAAGRWPTLVVLCLRCSRQPLLALHSVYSFRAAPAAESSEIQERVSHVFASWRRALRYSGNARRTVLAPPLVTRVETLFVVVEVGHGSAGFPRRGSTARPWRPSHTSPQRHRRSCLHQPGLPTQTHTRRSSQHRAARS